MAVPFSTILSQSYAGNFRDRGREFFLRLIIILGFTLVLFVGLLLAESGLLELAIFTCLAIGSVAAITLVIVLYRTSVKYKALIKNLGANGAATVEPAPVSEEALTKRFHQLLDKEDAGALSDEDARELEIIEARLDKIDEQWFKESEARYEAEVRRIDTELEEESRKIEMELRTLFNEILERLPEKE